jgi:CHAT domain-containing protein
LESALQLVESLRINVAGAEKERAGFFNRYAWAYELMMKWKIEMNRLDEAHRAIERCRARALLDQTKVQGIDLLATVPPREAGLLRQRESATRAYASMVQKQLDALEEQKLPDAQKNAERSRLEQQLLAARDEEIAVYREIRNASIAYRLMVGQDFQPVTMKQLVSWTADEKSLLLQYSLGDENSYLFVIGNGTARAVKLQLTTDEAKSVGTDAGPLTHERAKAATTLNGQELPQRLAAAQKDAAVTERLAALWKVLIPEAEREGLLSGQYKRLILIPDGPLVNLPFDTLVVERGGEPVYLLDPGPPIVVGPSATLLYNLAHRESAGVTKNATQPVLTVGNPIYSPARAAPWNLNPSASTTDLLASFQPNARFASRSSLKSLPHSGNEVNWVAEMLGKMGYAADKLLQADATESKLRAAVAGRKMIHLACHGLVDNKYGNFFGSLALTPGPQGSANPADDGFLMLSEIYELNLKDCELAILSACQTNYGPDQRGEGVWALSRGFLVAGSRRVIASNWLVDDASAASLVSVFCSLLAKQHEAGQKLDCAAALHDAKRWIRKQDKWKDPYYWGTFVLIGPN